MKRAYLLMLFCMPLSYKPVLFADTGNAAVEQQPTATVQWQRAIVRDDIRTLKRLLRSNEIDPHTPNSKGKNALMVAAKTGDQQFYQRLQDLGLSHIVRSNTGGTVLMYAVLGNQPEMTKQLSRAVGAEINAHSTNGWTASMIASAKGFTPMLELLVAAGADVNIPDAYLWTPLMRAIDNRHRTAIDFLLQVPGVKLNSQNENRATVLHIAASVADQVTVKKLLALGADPKIKNNLRQTAADIAQIAGFNEVLALLKHR